LRDAKQPLQPSRQRFVHRNMEARELVCIKRKYKRPTKCSATGEERTNPELFQIAGKRRAPWKSAAQQSE
jgi:hypothetical protein